MEKIIIANKPRGKTSRQIVEEYKKIYPQQKVGHAGTLDPLAEGLLIILVGKATKKQNQFMKLKKEYWVEAVFGIITPTWDIEGEMRLYPNPNLREELIKLTRKKVEERLKKFSGLIEQLVPAYSAVKVKGKRLYQLARQGKIKTSHLPRRKVKIDQIELVRFWPAQLEQKKLTPQSLLHWGPKARIRMVVGKGTYVRSIIYQLGEDLGLGATTSRLIRTKIGNFSLQSKFLFDTNGDQ